MAFPLFAIAGKAALGAGKAILGAGKTVAKAGARTGASVASSIMKRKSSSKEVSIAPKDKSSISSDKLIDRKYGKEAPDGKSSGVSSIDRVLDEIDNTLFNVINLVVDSSKLKKNESLQQQRHNIRKRKGMREDVLERSSSLFSKISSPVRGAAKGLGKMLSQFFGNVLLGSLALLLVNNWDNVVFWFKKGFEKIKELWEALGKGLKSTWNALKWIVSATGGQDLVKKGEKQLQTITGDVDKTANKMEKEFSSKIKEMSKWKWDDYFNEYIFGIPPLEGDNLSSNSEGSFVDKFLGIGPAVAGTLDNKPRKGNSFWTLVAVAALEDNDGQGRADVAQSIYNRASSGVYGSNNIRDLILQKQQYEPTWKFPKFGKAGIPNAEWYMIDDAKSAAAATGLSVSEIKRAASQIKDKNLQKKAAVFVGGRTDFMGGEEKPRFDLGDVRRKENMPNNFFGHFVGPASEEYGRTSPIAAPVPMDLSSSIRNQASYDIAGGTTIIMMGGGNQSSSGGQEGSPQLLPIPVVNSMDYTIPLKTELAKA